MLPWPSRRSVRPTWLVCSRTPTSVPSTPRVSPSDPRTSSWPALDMFVTLLERRRKGGTVTYSPSPGYPHTRPTASQLQWNLDQIQKRSSESIWYFEFFTKCQIRLESNGHTSEHSNPKVKSHSSSTFLFFSLSLSFPSIVVTFLACRLQYRKLWALKVYGDNFVFSPLSFYSYNKIS